ncbi:MAG TPA: hydrogenase accessory protein HypB [Caldithrix abyssi]|uniref:Hydrogenase accessory protein HypB n=1 Tax=Caldithrix abyssi TaxID=187145 RepID=A0A7V4WX17_CALAY|nr:hydrogenase accessory protein HypB [Caldithrix abyssi]
MCDTCGCGQPADAVTFTKPGDQTHHHEHPHPHDHNHEHPHDHTHSHDHDHHHHHTEGREVTVEQDVLSRNNLLAERNRGFFEAKNILALNLVSSPGSGKTTLLERTINDLKKEIPFAVIEGDQQTMQDAERIHAVGAPVLQVNTGNGCHLDAEMINRAVKELNVADNSVLMIENVGNLVCPALFDLGEARKVVIISVTEGDDKPLKYPTMFGASEICIINKVDLLPYVDFDVEKCKTYASKINHHLTFFELSAKTGEGLEAWYRWLKEQVRPQ